MSAPRFPQVKQMRSPEALRERLAQLGIGQLGVDDSVDPNGPLAQPFDLVDGSAGRRRVGNRFTMLPMEGWDGTESGAPSELVERRWIRMGTSGAKLIWGEATAVVPEGRANPNQLMLNDETAQRFAGLRAAAADAHRDRFGTDDDLVIGLQLTHSGRWSRPDGSPRPRLAHDDPLLARRTGAGAVVMSDADLDELVGAYVRAAVLARRAGFDFVDVKHCHGYLLHELLSATDRAGRYGGDLSGRTAFLCRVVDGIRAAAPDLAIAVRLSVYDFVPFTPGADRVGVPESSRAEHAFGGDGSGVGVDLGETHAFLDRCRDLGIGLVSVTAGSPYTTPHIQRPASFPPSDGYLPPEDPLVGVARLAAATAELQRRHRDLALVAGAMSYLQDWLPNVAQALVRHEAATSIGLGRMALAYPDLPADVLAGRPVDRRRICRTLSDCTTAPRNGLVSGCYPLDPFYKERPERVALAAIKRAMR